MVFAVIVWSLTDTVFPAQSPGFSTGAYIAMAFATAVLFFTSLLLHEPGHAVTPVCEQRFKADQHSIRRLMPERDRARHSPNTVDLLHDTARAVHLDRPFGLAAECHEAP